MPLSEWKRKHKLEITDDIMALHKSCVIVDLHIDTFMLVRHLGRDIAKRGAPVAWFNVFQNAVDVPRLKEGGVLAPCWGVVVFPIRKSGFFNSCMKYLDCIHNWHEEHPGLMNLVTTGSDMERLAGGGEIAGLLGMEGAHPLMGKMENLDALYERGVRYLTLTHFNSNEAAICATDRSPAFTGLSDFGRDLVARCNEIGMVMDLAHVSRPSFLEAASLTKQPVIVSHTGVCGVKNMWRNIDDDQIDAVAETGGVIGLVLHNIFLGDGPSQSVEKWADHVDYVVQRVGVDHAALGSDFDGGIIPPREIEDITDMPQLTAALLKRGYSEDDIRKIMGLNALRVFKQVLG